MTLKKTTADDIFAPFGLAVFERLSDGSFEAVGELPGWVKAVAPGLGDGVGAGNIDLAAHFPMLEIFLPDAENAKGPVESDVWTETDAHGAEVYVQAVATTVATRRFIGLRSLPEALFTYQQLAHDFELEKDKVERLSRELEIKRQEAERATQAKSDFLATMSHEFRTPLNAIIGMADVLSLTSLTPEQQKYVEIFQRSGVSLLNLINEILDLSKVESGHVELEATELDLPDVLSRAMEIVEVRVAAKGLWLRKSIAPDVPRYFTGDPNRLRQIIVNLLGNAIKFTEQGGLEVSVERDPENPAPGRLRFAITDTGIGIAEDKMGLIFESFTQADSSTTRKYGGTGLGLTISKQLIELMEGRVWVTSKVGVGSTFFFTARLGVLEDQTDRAVARPAQIGVATLSAGLRVLLVDDSEDNRTLILRYLQHTQSEIEIAENGQIGVDRFKTGHYDIVLMDVEMPVMDGYAAVREIRRIERDRGMAPTPVFALTAHAFTAMAAKGYEAGFTELLTKPIRRTTLIEAMAKHAQADDTDAILVHIDEGMEDVVPDYLRKRRADVTTYRERLQAADFDAIRKLAHKMKGTGTGYGFPRLTELGSGLETAAFLCDAPAIQAILDEFARYVNRLELE
jgi:signal transduction histidine kinase/CheY-like chemotaxis protein